MDGICKIEGCNNPYKAKGFCLKHYKKFLKYGDPLYQKYIKNEVCKVEGCNKIHVSLGLCDMHYRRLRKHGDPAYIKKEYPKICSIDGCTNSVEAKGYCGKHYLRFQKYGDPLFIVANREMERHGMTNTSEYRSWFCMKQRCLNPNNQDYKEYAGRGITVCDRWKDSFIAFYADMGPKPFPNAQIDRRENDKGYYKSNCRWVTPKVNANNRRPRRKKVS